MKKIKKFLKEINEKVEFKNFALTFVVIFITYQLFPDVASAATSEPPGMVEKSLSALLRGFAWAIEESIIQPSGRPIQTLVFNQGITASSQNGIQLLSGNGLSLFMIEIYSVVQWIAAIFFVPMGLVIAIDFKRSAENAQHRAVLKDRIVKLCLTFVLITSMPLLLNIIFQFNNVLVDVFNNIGTKKIKDASSFINEQQGTMLMDAFKQRAQTNKTFLDGALYLMSSVLNLWMLFYYMVRDLTIGFLFMLFPIVAIFYPFNKNMVTTWFKEMSSNILTQAIHGGILCIVIGMAASFGKSPNLYQQLFVMVAFGSLIPITATIKRLVGLEGSVGAASSMAGLGTAMGAVALAGGVMKSAKGAIGNVSSGVSDLRNLNAEKQSILNGSDGQVSSSGSMDKELPLVNQGNGLAVPTIDRDKKLQDVTARQHEARKKIFQGATGVGVGALSSGVMAIAGGGLGGKTAMAGAAGGFIAGESLGAKTGDIGYNTGASLGYSAKKMGKDFLNERKFSGLEDRNTILDLDGNVTGSRELVDEENGIYQEYDSDKNFTGLTTETDIAKGEDDRQTIRRERMVQREDERLGVNNEALKSDPEAYKNEKKARQLYDKYTSLGQHEKAFRAYAKNTIMRKSPEELQKIGENPDNGDMMMYRDKNMSVAYTEKMVSQEDDEGNISIIPQRQVLWTGGGDPNLVTPNVAPITFNNGSKDLPPEVIKDITVQAEMMAREVVGPKDVKDMTEAEKMTYNHIKNNSFQNGVKSQQERIVKLRVELGCNNAYMPTMPKNHVPIPSSVQSQVEQSVGKIEGLAEQKQSLLDEMKNFNNSDGQIKIDTGNLAGLYGQLNG
jgi:uncharacterized alkaline shock family protein YloU